MLICTVLTPCQTAVVTELNQDLKPGGHVPVQSTMEVYAGHPDSQAPLKPQALLLNILSGLVSVLEVLALEALPGFAVLC